MKNAINPKDILELKRAVSGFKAKIEEKGVNYTSQSILLALLFSLSSKFLRSKDHCAKGPKEILQIAKNLSGIEIIDIPEALFEHVEEYLYLVEAKAIPLVNQNVSILGDIYQIWQTTQRTESLGKIQQASKEISAVDLIAFTQIYTPDWIVDFLSTRTLDRKINSILESDKNTETKLLELGKIKILDPACGSGHFLVKAFQTLLATYRTLNLPDSESINLILSKQIHGVDVDAFALSIVSLTITIQCLKENYVPGKRFKFLEFIELERTDSMGSLYQQPEKESFLNSLYDVILSNPPYIGRKLMDRQLKEKLKKHYPDSYQDLSSAFVKRCLTLLKEEGRFGVITQASILALPTYRKLRKYTIQNYNLDLVVDLGPGIFPTQKGEKINSALLIFQKPSTTQKNSIITFWDIKGAQNKHIALNEACKNMADTNQYHVKMSDIENVYNYAFNYQIPSTLTKQLLKYKSLNQVSDIKQGLATTDNKKFVRYLWQISPQELNQKWYHYAKGAGSDKWFSPVIHVVDWQDNGLRIKERVKEKYPYLKGKANWVVKNEDYYFKPGLSFSFVSTNGLSVRKLPANCIFDVGASSIFPESNQAAFLLGYLNSSFVNAFVSSINPTINFQVGDLKRIPIIEHDQDAQELIKRLTLECCEISEELHNLTNPAASYLCKKFYKEKFTPFSLWLLEIERTSCTSIESVFKQFEETIVNSINELNSKEDSINEVIMHQFAKTNKLNTQEESELVKWIGKVNHKSKKRSGTKTEAAFSAMVQMERLLPSVKEIGLEYKKELLTKAPLLFDSTTNSYLKEVNRSSLGKTFICRSFRTAPPSDLLLEEKMDQ